MARLRVFSKRVTGQVFPIMNLPSALPPVFDNPTPEQIEAFGLKVADPEPEPEETKKPKRGRK